MANSSGLNSYLTYGSETTRGVALPADAERFSPPVFIRAGDIPKPSRIRRRLRLIGQRCAEVAQVARHGLYELDDEDW